MKNLIITAVLAAVITTGVFAQTSMGLFPTSPSPTSLAAQELYKSDADNYISPNWFNETDFETVYGKVSFASGLASLGAAVRVNDLYIAASYDGSFFGGSAPSSYSEPELPFSNSSGKKKFKLYTSGLNVSAGTLSVFNILAGIGDLGLMFSLASDYNGFSGEDIAYGSTQYKKYSSSIGSIIPAISFGMASDMMENGVRPYGSLSFDFYNDSRIFEMYESDGSTLGEQIGRSSGTFNISLLFGLGGYTLFQNESGVKAVADIEYLLDLGFNPGNNYTLLIDGKYKKFDGQVVSGYIRKYSSSINLFRPSARVYWEGGRLALAAGIEIPFAFNTDSTSFFGIKSDGNEDKIVRKLDNFNFIFAPALSLGLKFDIIPEKLFLNAGGYIGLSSVTLGAGGTIVYDADGKEDTNVPSGSSSFNGTSTRINIGLGFNLTENVSLEATAGTSSNGSSLSIFSTSANGLLNFLNILASIKF